MPIVASRKNTLRRVQVPLLGLDYSLPSTVVDEKNSFAKNCRVFEGDLKQRAGHADFGTAAMSDVPIHLTDFFKTDLSLSAIRVSSTKTEVYNTGTTAWDDITKSATDWTGTEGTTYYDSTVFNDKLLITNQVDAIQQYTGTGLCTDLSGPPKAKFIESFNNYVVLAHIIDGGTTYPAKVQWSDTGDETDWTTGNAGSHTLDDEPDPIIGMRVLNESIVVYKANHIYIGRLIDTINVFQFYHVISGVGLLNNRCIVSHNSVHYFLGSDGQIYGFNGTRVEGLGDEVRDQIFSRLNTDRLNTCHARKDTRTREIQFYITVAGNNWPTEVYKLNYETGAIFLDEVDNVTATMTFKDATVADEDWDSDSATWDSDTTRWDDSLGGSGFSFKLIAKADFGVYKELDAELNDDDTAIDQEFVTKDFSFEAHETLKRWLHLEFHASGSSLLLSYSTDCGSTWTAIPKDSDTTTFTLTDSCVAYDAWFDTKSNYIRFKFKNNTLGESFRLRQFTLEARVAEERYR